MRSTSASCRLRSRLWPALVILLLLLQLLWPSRIWAAMLGLMGGGWLIAFLWARSLARGLGAHREMRYGWTQVGDRLEERFTLSNAGWAPATWIEVQDHSDLPGYNASRVTAVDREGFTQWRTRGVCSRRGLFTIGPASLACTDPFGMYSVSLPVSDSGVLLVLPPVLALPSIEVAAGGRAGEGHRHRRSALEQTVSVETVRPYVNGDPLHSIHWPTSARSGSLYVRQFEKMPSSDWWICLDMYQHAQVGEGDRSTAEYGVLLAASLADRGLRQGHGVGLAACGREMVWIPPQRESGQLMELLRALAIISPGDRPLEHLLDHLRPSLHGGASLILITPDLRPQWIPALLHLVKVGITPTVLLLDPLSFGGEKSARGMADWLGGKGIARTLITPDLLDPPAGGSPAVAGGAGSPSRKSSDALGRPIQVEWKRTR